MKHLLGMTVACLVFVVVARGIAADVLSDFGISEGRAREAFFDSFASGSVSLVGNVQVFMAASPQVRASIVKTVTARARSYAEGDDFARRYIDHREANAPDPLPPAKTAEDVLAKQRADYEKQVAEMRAMFDEITPQQRVVLERGFDEMRARFDAMDKDGTKAQLTDLLNAQHDRDAAVYAARMKDFERDFPKDSGTLIAMRLQRFLDMTRDIDFSARLVERDKKMRFADATLEARPAEWKMCFRAGQPATQIARDFAQDWLHALERKGVE